MKHLHSRRTFRRDEHRIEYVTTLGSAVGYFHSRAKTPEGLFRAGRSHASCANLWLCGARSLKVLIDGVVHHAYPLVTH